MTSTSAGLSPGQAEEIRGGETNSFLMPPENTSEAADDSSAVSEAADSSPDSSVGAFVSERQWRRLLVVVLLLYACVQCLYIRTTPLQRVMLPENLPQVSGQQGSRDVLLVGIGPDEAAHFLYILSLARQGALPVPKPSSRTAPQQYTTYQAQHPPLFYALAAVLYRMTARLPEAALWYLLRAFCAVCGGVVILLAAQAARLSFPDRPLLALAAAPIVAFLPIFGYMTATLSNEPLEMVFGAWAWLQLVRLARQQTPYNAASGALLGLTLGLAALSRFTALLWLPAIVIVLLHCARRGPRLGLSASLRALSPLLTFALCFGLVIAPWLIHNQLAFGSPIIRAQYRPMLTTMSLLDFIFGRIFFSTSLTTAFWYASTAWFPFWLTQYALPGGLAAARLWQGVCLALDGLVLLSLGVHHLRARRRPEKDAAGRVLLWAAFSAVAFCVLTLLQQQLYSDWQVVFYGGRYLAAAAPAGILMLLMAISTWIRPSGRGLKAAALGIAALMLAFDLYTVFLIQQFYATHPNQPFLQEM